MKDIQTIDGDSVNWQDNKEKARELYMGYANLPSISQTTGIKLATIKSWVYGLNSKKTKGWKFDRELSKNQLLKDLSKDKRGMVYNMVDGAMFLLHDFVESKKKIVVESGKSIDLKTAEKLTNILGSLTKIVESDKDQDDDATFTKPTDIKELKDRVVKADPFSADDIDDAVIITADSEVVEDDELM